MTFNVRGPKNRFDPDSLSRIGGVEADEAEAQYLGVVVEPEKKKSFKWSSALVIILVLGAASAIMVVVVRPSRKGSNERSSSKKDEALEKPIAEVCHPVNLQQKHTFYDCFRACEHCCPHGICPVDANCREIEVCNILMATSESHPDSVVRNVTESCSGNLTNSTKQGQCLGTCEHGRCCFFPESSDHACISNFDEDINFCKQYQICSRLDDVIPDWFTFYDYFVNETQFVINRTCSPLENNQLGDVQQEDIFNCHNLCDNHLCCFTDQEELNCKDTNSEMCEFYKPCEVLLETSNNKTIQETVDQANAHCTSTSLSTYDGYSSCYSVCSPFLCCFSDENNCNRPGYDVCEQLAVCENVMDFTSDGSIDQTASISSQVDSACNETSLKTVEGIQKCHAVCKGHMCCFADSDSDCTVAHPFECTMYESCGNLLIGASDNDSSAVTHEQVKAKCENVQTNVGLEACKSVCAEHLCCFQESHLSSSCQNTTNCESFKACEILVNGDTDPDSLVPKNSSIPLVLTNECNNLSTESSQSHCANVCNQARCCFKDGAGNCYAMNKDWCEKFSKCEELANSGIDSHYEDGPSSARLKFDIANLCTTENLEEDSNDPDKENLLTTCHHICDPYDCCFTGNCSSSKQQDCPEYIGCADLYRLQHPSGRLSFTSTYLEFVSCFPSNYETDPTECNALCEATGSKCCFETGEQNCFIEQRKMCTYNALCSIVYEGHY